MMKPDIGRRVTMQNISHPLNDEEIDRLDRFLLDRIDDEADTEDKDEGVLDISELDGFFTALVSGPVIFRPRAGCPRCGVISSRSGNAQQISRLSFR